MWSKHKQIWVIRGKEWELHADCHVDHYSPLLAPRGFTLPFFYSFSEKQELAFHELKTQISTRPPQGKSVFFFLFFFRDDREASLSPVHEAPCFIEGTAHKEDGWELALSSWWFITASYINHRFLLVLYFPPKLYLKAEVLNLEENSGGLWTWRKICTFLFLLISHSQI